MVAVVCLVSLLYLGVLDRQLDVVTAPGSSRAAVMEVEEDAGAVAALFFVAYFASAVAFLMWKLLCSQPPICGILYELW